jgi:hypothetical protein
MKSARRWLVPGLCVVFAIGYAVGFLMHNQPLWPRSAPG